MHEAGYLNIHRNRVCCSRYLNAIIRYVAGKFLFIDLHILSYSYGGLQIAFGTLYYSYMSKSIEGVPGICRCQSHYLVHS